MTAAELVSEDAELDIFLTELGLDDVDPAALAAALLEAGL